MNRKLPTAESLLERYKIACDLKQPVNREKITECMLKWWKSISKVPITIRFAETAEEWIKAVIYAIDARAAIAVRDVSWYSSTAIGATEIGNTKAYDKWIPIFEAFEFGAFCFCITGSEIVVCDLPKKVLVDEFNLLHCEDGPAFEWLADVFEYYIHGVNVPEKVVLSPETITLGDIDNEGNAEVRRIMMDRYGMDRYFLDSGAKLLDFDFVRVAINDNRTMPRMLVQAKHKDKWLVGTDGSTTRVYHMPVFPWAKTCREAHCSICGLWDEQIIAQG